ncbi:MAG TPA: YfiR family protein, partial [Thermoanaerobaculia bacterium]|nr:YfiR family protein [Thermoanaerobaculia bacterium]
LDRPESAGTVQILYLGAADDRDVARALSAVQGKPVLTVADGDGLDRRRVMLTFRIRDSRVRFEVNLALAEDAGLKISSQLLKLALAVERR